MLSADVTIVDAVSDKENQNIDSLKFKELKDLCGKKWLSNTGNKQELGRRIRSADAEKGSEIPVLEWRKRGRSRRRSGIVSTPNFVQVTSKLSGKYKTLKKQELRQICIRRNIPASGNIPVLIN